MSTKQKRTIIKDVTLPTRPQAITTALPLSGITDGTSSYFTSRFRSVLPIFWVHSAPHLISKWKTLFPFPCLPVHFAQGEAASPAAGG